MNYISPNIKTLGKNDINLNNKNKQDTWIGNFFTAVGPGYVAIIVVPLTNKS